MISNSGSKSNDRGASRTADTHSRKMPSDASFITGRGGGRRSRGGEGRKTQPTIYAQSSDWREAQENPPTGPNHIEITLATFGMVVAIWIGLAGAFGTLKDLTNTGAASIISVTCGIVGSSWVLAFRYCYLRLLWKQAPEHSDMYNEYTKFMDRLKPSKVSVMYTVIARHIIQAIDPTYKDRCPHTIK